MSIESIIEELAAMSLQDRKSAIHKIENHFQASDFALAMQLKRIRDLALAAQTTYEYVENYVIIRCKDRTFKAVPNSKNITSPLRCETGYMVYEVIDGKDELMANTRGARSTVEVLNSKIPLTRDPIKHLGPLRIRLAQICGVEV